MFADSIFQFSGCLENAHLAENYLQFAVWKIDDMLELAKERLRGLKQYMHK